MSISEKNRARRGQGNEASTRRQCLSPKRKFNAKGHHRWARD